MTLQHFVESQSTKVISAIAPLVLTPLLGVLSYFLVITLDDIKASQRSLLATMQAQQEQLHSVDKSVSKVQVQLDGILVYQIDDIRRRVNELEQRERLREQGLTNGGTR